MKTLHRFIGSYMGRATPTPLYVECYDIEFGKKHLERIGYSNLKPEGMVTIRGSAQHIEDELLRKLTI